MRSYCRAHRDTLKEPVAREACRARKAIQESDFQLTFSLGRSAAGSSVADALHELEIVLVATVPVTRR